MAKRKAASQAQWQNRIVGEGEADPKTLMAHPLNWRSHSSEQERALSTVLDTVGWVQRAVISKNTGRIVDGHLRVAMAISKGEKSVPVLYVDLSEDEEALILASLDPIGAMASTDADKLRELLGDIPNMGEDVDALLAEIAAMNGLDLEGEPEGTPGDAEPQVDRAEELNKVWKVKTGDLFGLGAFTRCPGCGNIHNLDGRK